MGPGNTHGRFSHKFGKIKISWGLCARGRGIWRGIVEITPDTHGINVFYKAIDSVLADMATRYQAISVDVSRNINRKFSEFC